MMEKFYEMIDKNRKKIWFITLGYIFFNGWFLFPLRIMTKAKTIDYQHLSTIVCVYIIIALFFVGLMRAKPIIVYLLTLFLTAMAMGCRYLVEFGETSTIANFTGINILVFLITIPLFVMLAYLIIPKLIFDK